MIKSKQERRGKRKRQQRRIILIGCEGHNRTERIYFHRFNSQQKKYRIHFSSGNYTDPLNIVSTLKSESCKLELLQGDEVFAVIDLDNYAVKEKQLSQAKTLAKQAKIKIITSNPCFEAWFLAHFVYTTKCFTSSKKLLKELKKYIPNYCKNQDYFDILVSKTSFAIENCKKIEDEHKKAKNKSIFSRNPSSLVYKIVEKILK